jgi:hypothetical protein
MIMSNRQKLKTTGLYHDIYQTSIVLNIIDIISMKSHAMILLSIFVILPICIPQVGHGRDMLKGYGWQLAVMYYYYYYDPVAVATNVLAMRRCVGVRPLLHCPRSKFPVLLLLLHCL